jgi:hypothetical protein
LSKYKNPDFAGIIDPSGNPMCTGVVSGRQAGRPSLPPVNARLAAAITLICNRIRWRLAPTWVITGNRKWLSWQTSKQSTPRNFLEKLIVVRAAERAAS